MLVKDKIYANRTINVDGQVINFINYTADVADTIAAKLISRGDFEPLEKVETTFPFLKSSFFNLNKPRIFYDGALGRSNGYGKAGLMLIDSLETYLDTYIVSGQTLNENENEKLGKKITKIAKKEPRAIDGFYLTFWPGFKNSSFSVQRQIIYTMFESTKIPESWVENINKYYERVFVPCEANKKAFENSGVDKPIHVVNLPFDSSAYPYQERIPQPEYIFGTEGNLTYRKGIDVGVKAFLRAFPREKYPNVYYKIKSKPGAVPWFLNITNQNGTIVVENDPRIVFISEDWTEKQLLENFYYNIDCYLFPSRGEGWGLTTVQAMSTGLPVIMSNCSGLQDQHRPEHSYLTKTKVALVPPSSEGGFPEKLRADGMEWWEPDVDDLVEKMLEVYENQDKAIQKGKKAAEFVRKEYSLEKMGKKIFNILKSKV